MKFFTFLVLLSFCCYPLASQDLKIKHADPVFEDLTTDLGGIKGENELNINLGYRKMKMGHHDLITQLEYEFVPVDNWGFEVVIPYNAYFNNNLSMEPRPDNQMEFVQWATQYTFHKNNGKGISMALGFRNVFEIASPENEKGLTLETINYYPFLIFAKNLQDKYFFLLSGGPEGSQDLEDHSFDAIANANMAFHYSIKSHFIGVELNNVFEKGSFESYIRPQVILNLTDDFIVGAAFGIPFGLEDDRWNGFLRLAYEF